MCSSDLDRFVKGECPKCGAKDQYGDNCESCGAVYAPTELKKPYSALSGAFSGETVRRYMSSSASTHGSSSALPS